MDEKTLRHSMRSGSVLINRNAGGLQGNHMSLLLSAKDQARSLPLYLTRKHMDFLRASD